MDRLSRNRVVEFIGLVGTMAIMKIMVAQTNPTVGDIEGNTEKVLAALARARKEGAGAVLFSELTLSGYFPDDLLLEHRFIESIAAKIPLIAEATKGLFVVVGLPRKNETGTEKPLYNSAAVFADGKLLGFQNKTLLPTYDVFDERRFFEPGTEWPIWEYGGERIAITICEDVWHDHYRTDPVEQLRPHKPTVMLNLSGSPYSYRRLQARYPVFARAARQLECPVILCNQVGANDQIIFDGYSFCLNAKGECVAHAKGFVEDTLLVDLRHLPTPSPLPDEPTQDLYRALVLGVRDYFHKQGFSKALLGLSGGIDSSLVACIAAKALGAENVVAVGLPSRYSSEGSVTDAKELARILGIEWRQVEIESTFQRVLSIVEPFFAGKEPDETEENLQTRIRGMILMAFANKEGRILLNTGNKSEMAMGYTTLYGDMAGGLGVLHDVTKLRVYELARFTKIIPQAILSKIPSAELRENQTDFDTLPPFEVLDPVIEDAIERLLSPEEIARKRGLDVEFVRALVARMYRAEFKRRQAPIGLRVTQKAFGKGRVVPIVQKID